MKMKKLTYQEVKENIENIDGYVLISDTYTRSGDKLTIRCSNNHVFEMNYSNFKQGKRCLECQGVIRWNYEKVKNYIENQREKKYSLLSKEYKNMHTKLEIKCEKNHVYKVTFDSFYNSKTDCPRCQGRGKLTYEDVKNYIEIESSSGYRLLSKEYKNNSTKLDVMCPLGHIHNICYSSFQQGHRCAKCAEIEKVERQTYSYEYVKETIESTGYKLLSNSYKGSFEYLTVMCKENHIYDVTFSNFLMGKRCKECHINNNRGKESPRWNHTLTNEEREIQRNFEGYTKWRDSVYKRDNYTCQCCGDNKGGNLNAHHKDGYNWCIDRRIDVGNGVTLCNECHKDFHLFYEYGHNTEEQYIEWLEDIQRAM